MTDSTSQSRDGDVAWHQQWVGRILVAQFGLFSLLSILLIVIGPDVFTPLAAERFVESRLFDLDVLLTVAERFYIYVYSFTGAMAYVFIRLFKNVDMSGRTLFKLGLRVPAALLLVTVFYLLTTWTQGEVGPLHWTIAFLVGFYLTYAIETLDETTVRIFRNLFQPPERDPGSDRDGGE